MNIVIVSPYVTLPNENGSNRFYSLCEHFSNLDKVTLLTSSFSHYYKRQRKVENKNSGFTISLISEPGYKNNVSISRIFSHIILTFGFYAALFKILKRKETDVYYVAFPDMGVLLYLCIMRKFYKYKIVVDIQDMWPEAFLMLTDKIPNSIYTMMKFFRNKSMSCASLIITVSNTYSNIIKKEILPPLILTSYLGSTVYNFEYLLAKSVRSNNKKNILIGYAGSSGQSYDLTTIANVISNLTIDGYGFKLVIYSSESQQLNNLKKMKNSRLSIHKMIPHIDLIKKLQQCDLLLNSVIDVSAASVTNKMCDYATVSRPILDCQNNKELDNIFSEILIKYKAFDKESILLSLNRYIANIDRYIYLADKRSEELRKSFNKEYTNTKIVNFVRKLNNI
jgi:hypothetical protein